jgi:hypothetical protein
MDVSKDSYSIAEFCARHGISRSGFYNLRPEDRPQLMRVGARILISREAAEKWRREMERQTAVTSPPPAT